MQDIPSSRFKRLWVFSVHSIWSSDYCT